MKISEQVLLSELRDTELTEAITKFTQLQQQLQASHVGRLTEPAAESFGFFALIAQRLRGGLGPRPALILPRKIDGWMPSLGTHCGHPPGLA